MNEVTNSFVCRIEKKLEKERERMRENDFEWQCVWSNSDDDEGLTHPIEFIQLHHHHHHSTFT